MKNTASLDSYAYSFPRPLNKATPVNSSNEAHFFTEKNIVPGLPQNENLIHDSLLSEHIRAKNCIGLISDPLWQAICADLLNIMGAASILKLWKCKLGEFSLQDTGLNITCEGEKTAAFVRQYDFVILGSLQTFFPGLKELRVITR